MSQENLLPSMHFFLWKFSMYGLFVWYPQFRQDNDFSLWRYECFIKLNFSLKILLHVEHLKPCVLVAWCFVFFFPFFLLWSCCKSSSECVLQLRVVLFAMVEMQLQISHSLPCLWCSGFIDYVSWWLVVQHYEKCVLSMSHCMMEGTSQPSSEPIVDHLLSLLQPAEQC